MKKFLSAALLCILIACLAAIIALKSGVETPVAETTPTAAVTPASPIPTPTPTPTPTSTPTPTATPEPASALPDIDISSWEYLLVNPDHPLDSDYKPELTAFENGNYFDSRAVGALQDMLSAARAEGLSVYITSSYRSYSTQQYLFNNKVAQYGGDEAAAAKIVARPGTSEHQTGLAADIVDKYYTYMDESLAETDLSKWLYAHCAEYGFILRYPEDKQTITQIMYEPWHFRYVGVEAATYIMTNDLCLEEFLALYQ
ncbi:MAG: M15 family metallopeptidase [Oscillospiraceae bacterium]